MPRHNAPGSLTSGRDGSRWGEPVAEPILEGLEETAAALAKIND